MCFTFWLFFLVCYQFNFILCCFLFCHNVNLFSGSNFQFCLILFLAIILHNFGVRFVYIILCVVAPVFSNILFFNKFQIFFCIFCLCLSFCTHIFLRSFFKFFKVLHNSLSRFLHFFLILEFLVLYNNVWSLPLISHVFLKLSTGSFLVIFLHLSFRIFSFIQKILDLSPWLFFFPQYLSFLFLVKLL